MECHGYNISQPIRSWCQNSWLYIQPAWTTVQMFTAWCWRSTYRLTPCVLFCLFLVAGQLRTRKTVWDVTNDPDVPDLWEENSLNTVHHTQIVPSFGHSRFCKWSVLSIEGGKTDQCVTFSFISASIFNLSSGSQRGKMWCCGWCSRISFFFFWVGDAWCIRAPLTAASSVGTFPRGRRVSCLICWCERNRKGAWEQRTITGTIEVLFAETGIQRFSMVFPVWAQKLIPADKKLGMRVVKVL